MSKSVIIFSSPTCAPCKQIKPELETAAAANSFALMHFTMVRENAEAFAKYGVRGVPTVVCIDGDAEIGRLTGAQTNSSLMSHLVAWGMVKEPT